MGSVGATVVSFWTFLYSASEICSARAADAEFGLWALGLREDSLAVADALAGPPLLPCRRTKRVNIIVPEQIGAPGASRASNIVHFSTKKCNNGTKKQHRTKQERTCRCRCACAIMQRRYICDITSKTRRIKQTKARCSKKVRCNNSNI